MKGLISNEAKRKHREAPFDQKALIDDAAFDKAYADTRAIRHDDLIFHPHKIGSGTYPNPHRGGFRGGFRGRGARGGIGGFKGKGSAFFGYDTYKGKQNSGQDGHSKHGQGKSKKQFRGKGNPQGKPSEEE